MTAQFIPGYWSYVGISSPTSPLGLEEIEKLRAALGRPLSRSSIRKIDTGFSLFVEWTAHTLFVDGAAFTAFFKAVSVDPGRTLARAELSLPEHCARFALAAETREAGFDLETHAGGAWAADRASDLLKKSSGRPGGARTQLAKLPYQMLVSLLVEVALEEGAPTDLPQPKDLPSAAETDEYEWQPGLMAFVRTAVALAAERGIQSTVNLTAEPRQKARAAFKSARTYSAFTLRNKIASAIKTKVSA